MGIGETDNLDVYKAELKVYMSPWASLNRR